MRRWANKSGERSRAMRSVRQTDKQTKVEDKIAEQVSFELRAKQWKSDGRW